MKNTPEPFGLDDSDVLTPKRFIRDIRTPFQQTIDFINDGQTQCYGIVFFALVMLFIPTLSNICLLLGTLLFLLRLARTPKEELPLRMPLGTSGIDLGDPLPGRKKFSKPEGIFYLGNEKRKKWELWAKSKDMLTHTLLFGTTGSGKTETLISLNFNALATGSGFFYIDPKASPKLSMQICQLCRFCGRDDDFRVINYGISGKTQEKLPIRYSNTNNPFTIGNAESLTQILLSLISQSDGGNSIFADNGSTLISGVMYALVCLRDKNIIKLSARSIRDTLTVDACTKLVAHPDLDAQSKSALTAALQTNSWVPGIELAKQEAFIEQFGYAKAYFGKALSSLTDTYSHIYDTEDGEVDFSDVILQRRIALTLLPALEKSAPELLNLGKITLSAVKNACAVGLGSRIEGGTADVIESLPTDTIGIGPFFCTVDEYGAIVTPGFEIVLTQGRGLGIAVIVASQDWPGIQEADRKGAMQMLANTMFKIFMKIDDEKTFALAQSLTGKAEVLKTSGFSAKEDSVTYYDTMNTNIQHVDRVMLKDLQTQIEGEAHYITRGKVVRGDMFYASPNLKNAQLRIPQLVGVKIPETFNT